MTTLVELKRVSRVYPMGGRQVPALQEVDVSIQRGELTALWGPSGSGKSTLCNLIGLIDSPTAGTVEFEGHDTALLSDDECTQLRSRKIGFIFQSFNLMPVLSACENVMLPLQVQGESTASARAKAMQSLEEVGLIDFAVHRPGELSGGQQQRVAVARALVTRPLLVVADEPTANLDTETARSIIELIRVINRTRQVTFVFATHDQRLLDHIDRKILLQDGRIKSDEQGEGNR